MFKSGLQVPHTLVNMTAGLVSIQHGESARAAPHFGHLRHTYAQLTGTSYTHSIHAQHMYSTQAQHTGTAHRHIIHAQHMHSTCTHKGLAALYMHMHMHMHASRVRSAFAQLRTQPQLPHLTCILPDMAHSPPLSHTHTCPTYGARRCTCTEV